MQNVLKAILGQALMWPDRNALVLPDRVVTFGMLGAGISAVASAIMARGIDQSKPVGVLVSSPIRHVIVALALARCGYSSVSLRRSFLPHCAALGIQAVITDAAIKIPSVIVHPLEDSWFATPPDRGTLDVSPFTADHIVRIEFTSGSTGEPEPVGLTDEAVRQQTINRMAVYQLGSGDGTLCMFGVTTNVGFGFVLASLMQGRPTYFIESNDQALDMLSYHRIKVIAGSPAQLLVLAARAAEKGKVFPSGRKIILAGSQISLTEMNRIRLCFGGDVLVDYGSTETGPAATASGNLLSGPRQFPIFAPHQRIEVMGQTDASPEGAGPVRVRSSGMGWPYTGGLTQEQPAEAQRWFYTGDVGYYDGNGCLVIVGRSDDLFNFGGIKKSPESLEAQILANPAIREAAVVRTGETAAGTPQLLVAVVAANDAAPASLEAWVKSKLPAMAGFSLRIVPQIPKTESGKIDRVALRKQMT